MATLKKHWRAIALIAVAAVLGWDLANHLFNFPVRLGLLRVILLFAEPIWSRVRM